MAWEKVIRDRGPTTSRISRCDVVIYIPGKRKKHNDLTGKDNQFNGYLRFSNEIIHSLRWMKKDRADWFIDKDRGLIAIKRTKDGQYSIGIQKTYGKCTIPQKKTEEFSRILGGIPGQYVCLDYQIDDEKGMLIVKKKSDDDSRKVVD